MTDDVMKDLVTKHDGVINALVLSVDHLVEAQARAYVQQAETNKRLEEISKYLAKQAVFDTKLQAMDRDLFDSFKRVHTRIDSLEQVQISDDGCSSVKLLNKDVEALTKDIHNLVGVVRSNKEELDKVDTELDSYLNPGTTKWLLAIAISYTVLFGTYVVQSIHNLSNNQVKITTMMERQ